MLARPRVLLVEDDPPFARTLARLLAARYEVTVETCFGGASEVIARGLRFDAYLVDLHLGDGHASELYAQLGSEDRRRLIVLTGGAFTESDRVFLRSLLNPPLLKPFKREELHAALSSALSSPAE